MPTVRLNKCSLCSGFVTTRPLLIARSTPPSPAYLPPLSTYSFFAAHSGSKAIKLRVLRVRECSYVFVCVCVCCGCAATYALQSPCSSPPAVDQLTYPRRSCVYLRREYPTVQPASFGCTLRSQSGFAFAVPTVPWCSCIVWQSLAIFIHFISKSRIARKNPKVTGRTKRTRKKSQPEIALG